MTTLLDLLKKRSEVRVEEIKHTIKEQRNLKRMQTIREEGERIEQLKQKALQLSLPLTSFNDAIDELNNTITACQLANAEQKNALSNLIKQAKEVVAGCSLKQQNERKRIDELTSVISCMNSIVKGENFTSEQLDILDQEIAHASIFDKKINRVMIGIAKLIGGILLIGLLIAIDILAVISLMHAPISFEADPRAWAIGASFFAFIFAFKLIYDGIHSLFFKTPDSVAHEITNIIQSINLKEPTTLKNAIDGSAETSLKSYHTFFDNDSSKLELVLTAEPQVIIAAASL